MNYGNMTKKARKKKMDALSPYRNTKPYFLAGARPLKNPK